MPFNRHETVNNSSWDPWSGWVGKNGEKGSRIGAKEKAEWTKERREGAEMERRGGGGEEDEHWNPTCGANISSRCHVSVVTPSSACLSLLVLTRVAAWQVGGWAPRWQLLLFSGATKECVCALVNGRIALIVPSPERAVHACVCLSRDSPDHTLPDASASSDRHFFCSPSLFPSVPTDRLMGPKVGTANKVLKSASSVTVPTPEWANTSPREASDFAKTQLGMLVNWCTQSIGSPAAWTNCCAFWDVIRCRLVATSSSVVRVWNFVERLSLCLTRVLSWQRKSLQFDH